MKERVCYKCRFITFLLQAEPWTARPLHSSVVSGREFAIEVSHPVKGIHHLQCDSQGHVERWLAEFHQNKCPDRNNRRRHATQLELWVSEAKVKNMRKVKKISNRGARLSINRQIFHLDS